jgi:RNA 3'-terminal phosphate cyclase (ATP)
MLTIDGSIGEGGGQILRTALSLALCSRRPIRLVNIRARRPKAGLRPQHLAAVRAAAAVAGATVEGAAIGSETLTFVPNAVRAGDYRFVIGTAGSASLVLQTVLPALLTADGVSNLTIEGGTHNSLAPTFDCLAHAYLPLVARMGPRVTLELARPGFEPAGGGCVRARIEPVPRLEPLRLESRGAIRNVRAEILLARLPEHVAAREAQTLAAELGLERSAIAIRTVTDSAGPGNVVTVLVEAEHVTEAFVGFGRRGIPAERVARAVAEEARRYLAADVPVGLHLADQLLLPLALAGAGSFVTLPPSAHTLTNGRVIEQALPLRVICAPAGAPERWRIEVAPA